MVQLNCKLVLTSRGILARGNASKISTPDLVILDAALTGNRSYNISALIAQHLSTNSVKGPFYGGSIASCLLSYSGLSLDPTDIKFPDSRLYLHSMKSHHFVTRSLSQQWNMGFP